MINKRKIYLIGLVISTVILVTTAISVGTQLSDKSSKKNVSTKYLTSADNAAIIVAKKGDAIHLELQNYGDGGYTWNIVTQDQKILSLKEQATSQPSGLLGDFGNDIWVFTAEKTGLTTLSLQCSRSWDSTDTCATFTVQIEIQ